MTFVIVRNHKQEKPYKPVTATDVYNSISNKSLSDILLKGAIGDFAGYDWPDNKGSGIGGYVRMENPIELDKRPDIKYISITGV